MKVAREKRCTGKRQRVARGYTKRELRGEKRVQVSAEGVGIIRLSLTVCGA